MEELKVLRDKIDKIDNDIVDLYARRMELAKQIGIIKGDENKGVVDSGREKEIINIENLKNLDECVSGLFTFICLPIKIADSDGAPARAVAYFE